MHFKTKKKYIPVMQAVLAADTVQIYLIYVVRHLYELQEQAVCMDA